MSARSRSRRENSRSKTSETSGEDEEEEKDETSLGMTRAARRANAMRVLDVRGDDDASAIRQAYRRLALRHHPDKHRGDPDAEKKFKEVVRAYETLTRDGLGGIGNDGKDSGERFETAEDMRDFAASFFESFFFGGGFAARGQGDGRGGGGGRGAGNRRFEGDDASDGEYDDDDDESDSLPSLDDYDDDYDDDTADDYTDESDGEYTDLHNFFTNEPPPSSWGGARGGRGMAGKWFGRPGDSHSSGSQSRPGMVSDDQLFEHLEQMRKEAARYAAELAKQENEARRAAEPLEKLQRPTLVSRTDTSITLNLYRTKTTTQTLPQDRCWELSLKKDKEQNYYVFTSVKGKTIITVNDLIPGTKYCFKARVGRVDEATGEVTEWGPHSVESAYVTSGRAPTGNVGKQTAMMAKEDAAAEAGMGKKAKKRAAKEQTEREERARVASAAKPGASSTLVADEAAARQAALRRAAEEAAEREMAEMEAIRKRLEASKKADVVKAEPSAGEGLSKKAAQRKKKKERALAEELSKQSGSQAAVNAIPEDDFPETDEELARRLQAEEDRSSMITEEKYTQVSAPRPSPPSGPPPSWVAAPAMRLPGKRSVDGSSSLPPPGFLSGPTPMGASQRSRRSKDEGSSSAGIPPLAPGLRSPAGYNAAYEPQLQSQQPAWVNQGSGIRSTSTWGDAKGAAPAAAPVQHSPSQPAKWSPANSSWEPLGVSAGMSSLPLGDVFAADAAAKNLPTSSGLFSGISNMGGDWATSSVASAQWGPQTPWNGGAHPQQGSIANADWGLSGLGSELNSGASWAAFGGTSPGSTPSMWSSPADGLASGMNGMSIGSPEARRSAPRSPRSPGGEDPNLLDPSLLSFLG